MAAGRRAFWAEALRARANFDGVSRFAAAQQLTLFMVNVSLQYVVKYFHLKAAVMFPQVSLARSRGSGSSVHGPFVSAAGGGSQDRQGRHMVVSGREGE
jgi:hypothetical protein